MCECGCGNFDAEYRFSGPKGVTYAVQVTDPCDDCETPGGVIIYRLNAKQGTLWGVDDLPQAEFIQRGEEGMDELAIPVISPAHLRRHLLEETGNRVVQDGNDYLNLDELLDDTLRGDVVGRAMASTMTENRPEGLGA